MKPIKKLLVANRGEIAIRVFRAATELGIRTVAVYSQEDSGSLHRFKADEAYLIGVDKKPIDAYLDIEDVIRIAKESDSDAIHPGYGFLSENIELARRCREEGIIFVGPHESHLHAFGDKVRARQSAIAAGLPVIPGSDGPLTSYEDAEAFANEHGFPLMVKASMGGGGRGMRVIRTEAEMKDLIERAKSEAKQAFGSDEVYIEKLVERPKHIEVQILGDEHGHIVHLFERDCSVQRRHQKVVEVAPCVTLSDASRQAICDAAVQLMRHVGYVNAGTVEFLVTEDESFYFIEVNPRIQVEHTITEMVTGFDIVQTQLMIAQGESLHGDMIQMPKQEEIKLLGYAIQSRVTSEDPGNNFMPDTGKIMAYRSPGGFGVRLDGGNAYVGAEISPYYDSLLVKLSTHGMTFEQAASKMVRNLNEFRIRGIKTNIPFLINVMKHPNFISGDYNTSFIDETPELFVFPKRKDRGTKLLNYIGDVTVNGFPGVGLKDKPISRSVRIPHDLPAEAKPGTKQILTELGPDGLADWIKRQPELLLTDTTMRDAHQSLLATRMRTQDILNIAEPTSKLMPELFSVEAWGGATFDVAYRFLSEDPWVRLMKLREKMPNVLIQMLLRGANAVGYKNYADNVIEKFVHEAAYAGVDVFRIFDSLNNLESIQLAIDATLPTGKVAEAAICYTGDLYDGNRPKYHLPYYIDLAKKLEASGAHILAIKDMAGLLKPESAYALVSALKDAVDLPIHLHTHDASGNGIFTYARATDAGVDIVDVAASSMSGMTSQPSGGSLVYALNHHERQPKVDPKQYEIISDYWQDVRHNYEPFESDMRASNPSVYEHEMPGGQYSNLQQQAKAVGLGDRWAEVKAMYARVNMLFGDIVKVTPSSKVVGDMALFMVQHNLTEEDVMTRGHQLDFPDSVVEMMRGELGTPPGGFPKDVQQVILKGEEPLNVRPGKLIKPYDFESARQELFEKFERPVTDFELLAHALYPKVYEDYIKHTTTYGDVSVLDTLTFFYGLNVGETIQVEIETGKTLIIKLVQVSAANEDGIRLVSYEMNGVPREIEIKDVNVKSATTSRPKVDRSNAKQVGASMPGSVLKVLVEPGSRVHRGEQLLVTEAMKMETTIQAAQDGEIKAIHIKEGDTIQSDDLLIEFV
ncbi:pyruvate carboxylase [Exiguobacterium profundum]|uniref:pyruvate carboxylase n=1 Tax=Exiguobacterium TaxID=33986 RepID=UPI00093BB80C|nr:MULTISPECIES: pyruvate carboxylase [Exiguobacterium]QPI66737.1 pyruvate carboxylase [Exiguobacterium sp. PBE]MCT4797067.1 pyruvate carboxylase [Exiguobacterium profundum]MDT0191172.1 pyruvate carboxylase [Exiguobacterium sp. BG5(2022)]VXB03346.1 pyruvate carboxylase [Exiguobacterium sp. 8A]VXB03670.1 pyruvate carboxylase [Exiguobacterium sp. 8H]